MHTVVFQPSGRRAVASSGQDLLTVARSVGVEIESACGGKGSCGKCRVRVEMPTSGGSFDAAPEGAPAQEGALACASPASAAETKKLGADALAAGMRLACQTRVAGDMIVFVPEESRRVAQVVRKEASARTVPLDPAVRVYRLTLERPTLKDHTGDAERVLAALAEEHGLSELSFDFGVLRSLAGRLRQADWDTDVLVWRVPGAPGRIIDVRAAADARPVLGLAVDVGTTTIAAYLVDLTDHRRGTAHRVGDESPGGQRRRRHHPPLPRHPRPERSRRTAGVRVRRDHAWPRGPWNVSG